MTFNNPVTPHKGVVCNQEMGTTFSKDLQKRYSIGL